MPDYSTRLILGVLIPLISFVILALFGPRLGKPKASWVALLAIGLSCFLSTTVLIGWHGKTVAEREALTAAAQDNQYHWSTLGTISLDVGVKLDSLTVIMFFMVTFIAFWIHFFSIGYMAGHSDEVDGTSKYHRFFAYLGLFCFSMLGLVVSSSLLFMFFFWELVGLCSYLLIGFYFDKKYASNAAMKAFITNRVGDLGFIVGLMMVAAFLGTLDLEKAAAAFADQFQHGTGIFAAQFKLFGFEISGMAVATLMGIGLFCGAMGKSAQFPLHVWLPDAMAGPTPVSALIHAATMVAAGVYLVARIFRLLTPDAQFFIAVIGCITLTITALIAIVQTDIKKVLAYSTLSQLGYMIFGLGVGAWVAALFHLMTHAFFKAMLFLGSGQVIEGCHHEQDMRKMGGLKKKMPVTCWTFFLGVLAIAGFGIPGAHFGLGGYFSKDEILAVAYDRAFNIGGEHAPADGHASLSEPPAEAGGRSRESSIRHASLIDAGGTPRTSVRGSDAPPTILLAAADAPAHGTPGEGHDAHGPTGSLEKLKIASTLRRLPKWMFYLPIIIAYITPFYMMRAWVMTFWGKPRDHHVYDHAHESKMMFIPLLVLGAGTVFCSYLLFRPMIHDAAKLATNASAVVAIDGEAHSIDEAADKVMMTLDHHAAVPAHDWLKYGVGFSWLIGMGLAFLIYRNGLETADKFKRAPVLSAAHGALERKLFFDDIYDNILVGGTVLIAYVCKWVDRMVVDGVANGSAFATKAIAFFSGRQLDMKVRDGDLGLVDAVYNGLIGQGAMAVATAVRRPQNGRIRAYIVFAAGAAAVVLFVILFQDQISDSWKWLTAGRTATASTP